MAASTSPSRACRRLRAASLPAAPKMFSVPGKYTGGEKVGAYTWQQTLTEVELRAPIPAGPPERSVRCAFTAKKLELAFTSSSGEEAIAVGEVSAVLAASDCLWSVERDADGGAVAVISLRKAVPQVWTKVCEQQHANPAPLGCLSPRPRHHR